MGGAYWPDYSEHNIECDNVAARIVFDSGMLITAIGLYLTRRISLTEPELPSDDSSCRGRPQNHSSEPKTPSSASLVGTRKRGENAGVFGCTLCRPPAETQ